jgi:large subunit ribosomal protein L15
MKLHDLRPADGSRKERTRVGRGIAAGKGKTAGRGTKGQKARAGGSIPPWFEGGQTPLHMRIPKLRGFKNRFKILYEVVNVGAIDAAIERGAFETPDGGAKAKGRGKASKADAQITINQDLLRAAGLVKSLDKPLKILGNGELGAALFVVASARTKIEAAGGTVSVLEVPAAPLKALGVEPATEEAAQASTAEAVAGEPVADEPATPTTEDAPEPADEPVAEAEPADDTETDEAATTSGDDA